MEGLPVTTQTSDGDGGKDEPRPPTTRLEREVAEILERSERQPISFTDEVRRRGNATRMAARQSAARPESLQARFERLGAGRYLIVAVAAAVLALLVHPALLLLPVLLLALQVARVARRDRHGAMAWPNAFYTMLAKFPELQGMLRYARRRRAAGSAITYK